MKQNQEFQGYRFSVGKILGILLLFVLGFYFLRSCEGAFERNLVSYSIFRQHLEAGNVLQITVSGEKISGRFKQPVEIHGARSSDGKPGVEKTAEVQKAPVSDFETYLPSFGDAGLFSLLKEKKVEVVTRPARSEGWGSWGSLFFIFLLFGIGFMILQRLRMRGSDVFSSLDQNRARLYERHGRRTYFSDIAGSQAAKIELQEIVEFLKDPKRFQHLGGKMPKGALLVGPPGTGKTLLARAVAGEADVSFFSISGSDFMEVFVGVGASRVRTLFKEAKRVAPSIIFIDELDSIGRHRGLGLGGGRDERDQTLNQLLSEMDGFDQHDSVIVLAATNRPDVLDPALLRPGRFDRHINVDLPSLQDRLEILGIHARNKPLDRKIDFRTVARSTPGFSGADLENLLNEAAILAARKGKSSIEEDDVEESRDKVIMGLERRNLSISEEERRVLAYHEGGHAVVAALLPNADPLYKVTIIPRGRAMGVTQQLPEQDKYIYSKDYILDRLAVMLGGRAAEALVLNTSTSGSEDDLKQAMNLARKMVLDWGMSEELPHLALGGKREQYLEGMVQRPDYSEVTAGKIDIEVNKILEEAFNRATGTLQQHRDGLDLVAARLIDKEEIPGSEVVGLLKKERKAPEDAVRERSEGR
jgi:cell division protease FtsH